MEVTNCLQLPIAKQSRSFDLEEEPWNPGKSCNQNAAMG